MEDYRITQHPALDTSSYTSHPTPYTLRPTPYTMHSTPYTKKTSPDNRNCLDPTRSTQETDPLSAELGAEVVVDWFGIALSGLVYSTRFLCTRFAALNAGARLSYTRSLDCPCTLICTVFASKFGVGRTRSAPNWAQKSLYFWFERAFSGVV